MKVKDVDHGWKGILSAAMAMARDAHVKVGILGDSDRGGMHVEGSPLTVAEVAIVNEFGTADGHTPSRPAHRMTFDRRREEIGREAAHALTAVVIDRKITVHQALTAMGLKHATEVRKTITEGAGVPPPNAPSTVQAKGSSRPLVDTGVTVNVISYAVQIGSESEEAKYIGGK